MNSDGQDMGNDSATDKTPTEQELQALTEQLSAAQAQLIQSEKMATIGQIAAGVAHEINNPVGYIGSNLGILQGYIGDIERLLDALMEASAAVPEGHIARQALESVLARIDVAFLRQDLPELVDESIEGVTRVKQIVQDLKDFSHAAEEEWSCADIHRGLDCTLNIVNNEIKYKADVLREYGDLPLIECMAPQLNQVFMNLLVNASHAIDDRGTITLRTGTQDDWVWVEVADTGCGIPAENLKDIFNPFFTTKPVGAGTGLGLALVHDIVQKHRGRVDVSSEAGKGTTFRVWLPVSRDDDGGQHNG